MELRTVMLMLAIGSFYLRFLLLSLSLKRSTTGSTLLDCSQIPSIVGSLICILKLPLMM